MGETREAFGHIVYFAHMSISRPEWWKVGRSNDSVYDRIRTLNQGNPLRELDVPFFIWSASAINNEIETAIHKEFRKSYP